MHLSSILLVDDDPDVLDSIGDMLQVTLPGSKVLTASSGEAALQLLDREHPDALVTDFRMPGMDGLELTRVARRRSPRLPVVMVTAFDSEGLAAQAKDAGVCEVVGKPFDIEALVEAIEDCCCEAEAA